MSWHLPRSLFLVQQVLMDQGWTDRCGPTYITYFWLLLINYCNYNSGGLLVPQNQFGLKCEVMAKLNLTLSAVRHSCSTAVVLLSDDKLLIRFQFQLAENKPLNIFTVEQVKISQQPLQQCLSLAVRQLPPRPTSGLAAAALLMRGRWPH